MPRMNYAPEERLDWRNILKTKDFRKASWKDGERALLERLLTRRFGPLPDWGRDQLVGATLDQLNRWADRALEADSIQAVLAE